MTADQAQSATPRILAVLPDVPWPLNSGKRIREWAAVSALAGVGEVDALTVGLDVDAAEVPPDVVLRSAESVRLTYRSKLASGTRLATGRPWRVSVSDWTPAVKRIEEINRGSYDLVWFGSLDSWVELRDKVRARRVIVDIDDVETEKLKGFLASSADSGLGGRFDRVQARIEKVMWARIQKAAIRDADAVLASATSDARLLGTPKAVVIPNCYPDPEPTEAAPVDPGAILMVGNYSYEPNLDGAGFMARDVMPRVLEHNPGARLLLVGRGSSEEISRLGQLPSVIAVGEVESVADYLRTSRVAVAPVRYGGGTRIKLIEAFAYSLPTVSTTIGCHGLDVANGREVLVADQADDFARACCRILEDNELARALGSAGHDLYERAYRPTAVMDRIQQLASRVIAAS